MSTLAGYATIEGTRRFAEQHARRLSDFYTGAHGLTVSSLGLGTYLGPEDAVTDQRYEDAILVALQGGINHLDTAVSYRGMASERAVGRALAKACAEGVRRDGIVVATKGGYVPRDIEYPARGGPSLLERLVHDSKLTLPELVEGTHSLAPRFIEHLLATSLANLGVACIDIYYVHNPEAQLAAGVPRDLFKSRCRAAFEVLEEARRRGAIMAYGTATWAGYRRPIGSPEALQLEEMIDCARQAADSDDHGFRWVQLPINLLMPEALMHATQTVHGDEVTAVEAARRLGVAVVASGSIARGRLAKELPPQIALAKWPDELRLSSQRAIQFTRSAPGVTTALVGMSRAEHVRENLSVSRVPKLNPTSYVPATGSVIRKLPDEKDD